MKKYAEKLFVLYLFVILLAPGCGKEEEIILPQEKEETAAAEKEDEAAEVLPDICVYICGAVNRPGVYYLPEGSRLYEGISAAGGFLEEADQSWWNQAEVLTDGSRILVYTEEETQELEQEGQKPSDAAQTQGNGQDADGGTKNVMININTATIEELQEIPGIGASKAQAIAAYREENGRFSKIEDIQQVTGIKGKTFEKIKSYITSG